MDTEFYNKTYSKDFFKNMQKCKYWQVCIGEKLKNILNIDSAIDFGCGNGYYLQGLMESGCSTICGFEYGYELALPYYDENVKPFVSKQNIGEKIDCGKYDLTISIEVAEHLEPQYTETYFGNLCNSSSQYIFFSSSDSTCKGTGHINCHPKSFWIEKFEKRQFVLNIDMTNAIKKEFVFTRKYPKSLKNHIAILNRII